MSLESAREHSVPRLLRSTATRAAHSETVGLAAARHRSRLCHPGEHADAAATPVAHDHLDAETIRMDGAL